MTALSTRDALVKAIGEVPPCDHRLYGPCRECEADALIAAGAVVDLATLADVDHLDEVLVQVVRNEIFAGAGGSLDFTARRTIAALAAALTERAS